ncbi:E3 ubiquitin-protein ligase mind-bomb-like isoform X2 [Haliotis rubra]|uniref:E3 ubiquitin-protein ligase mind-bomb-like isoform X2 n=1 Tax=Haliotis rubra TaxID=36100 RepID=UPI001EE58E69|nr:E3 ubiquitin-protein ligase mind-bomb-like isoform X2 [Haliotis rubra]
MTATYPCPGIRVVRGPDWAGRDQDGGEGHVGTVVKIEDSDWAKGKVSVIWDSGREFQYRAGYDGKFELLVFDSGPTGDQVKGALCDGCGEVNISGMIWTCSTCTNFILCTLCYNTERHDTDHAFLRSLTINSPLVRVPPRSGAQRIRAIGLFKNAKVIRGPHWKNEDQYGGEGTTGDVVQLGAWSGVYSRGAVNVRWRGGQDSLKSYRIGAQGKVDVITVDETQGWSYYKAHLPVLDVVNPTEFRLEVGDKVKVEVDADIFERTHTDLTVYRDSMSQCLAEVGTVIGLPSPDRKIIVAHVQYPDAEKYGLVKSTLTRLHTFAVGDVVKITNNYNAAVDLQNGHGGWNDKMENCLGKTGQVVEIDKDGDLRVAFGPVKWFFSPVSCDPQDGEALSGFGISFGANKSTSSDSSTSDVDDIAEGVAQVRLGPLKPGASALFKPNASSSSTITARGLVIAVSNGDTETVKNIVKSIGDKVNESVDGLTALQTGCYKGHADIVKLLIGAKADLNKADDEGDTPLHYAVSGEQPIVVGILLDAKARGNTKNNKGLTPLHLAVAKKDPSTWCLKALIQYKCDPNTQDEDGDTPLHDALRTHNQHLLDPFLECAQLNLRLANSKGSNPFHEACVSLSGATEFPQALIKRDPKIVNVPMNNALTPIHIAAFRSFVALAGVLVKAGCNVNDRDDNGKTALHMAVQRCNLQIVQLLLESGAEINVQDQEGNSPLHATHMDSTLPGAEGPKDADLALEIRCHLVERGGDIRLTNKAGKTPLDFVKNKEVRVMLERISKRPLSSSVSQSKCLPAHWEAMGQDGFLKVELSESNPVTSFEYRHVESKVEETLSNKSIVSIYRIQNVALWEQYTVAKVNMEREYGRGLANEKQLFHGTTPDSADLIPHQNIDFRLAGSRVGALLGQGAYFAVDAKYSDGYAKEDARRHKFMFLAKVLVGKSRQGNRELKRPPVLDASNKTKLADSACDKETDPRIYVLFSEGQIYPEYLIEYH